MPFENMTLSEFTAELASKAAIPGGGGAAAMAGALGAALGSMVGNLTLGKQKYATVEKEMSALTEKAQALRIRMLAFINEDAEAFQPLSRAYSIPKDDPSREEIMEKCLQQAAKPPMEILRCCCQVVELLERFAQKGSTLAVSDAAVGAVLCCGAMEGAAVNVKVNTRAMKNKSVSKALEQEVSILLDEYIPRAQQIFEEFNHTKE